MALQYKLGLRVFGASRAVRSSRDEGELRERRGEEGRMYGKLGRRGARVGIRVDGYESALLRYQRVMMVLFLLLLVEGVEVGFCLGCVGVWVNKGTTKGDLGR